MNNVVSITGKPVEASDGGIQPSLELISAFEELLAMAKRGDIQVFIGVVMGTNADSLSDVFAGRCEPSGMLQLLGGLEMSKAVLIRDLSETAVAVDRAD